MKFHNSQHNVNNQYMEPHHPFLWISERSEKYTFFYIPKKILDFCHIHRPNAKIAFNELGAIIMSIILNFQNFIIILI